MLGVLCQAQFKLGLAKLVVATQLDCSARHSQVSLLSLVKAESAQLQLKLGLSLARIHRWTTNCSAYFSFLCCLEVLEKFLWVGWVRGVTSIVELGCAMLWQQVMNSL
jgi:hypothetical protein